MQRFIQLTSKALNVLNPSPNHICRPCFSPVMSAFLPNVQLPLPGVENPNKLEQKYALPSIQVLLDKVRIRVKAQKTSTNQPSAADINITSHDHGSSSSSPNPGPTKQTPPIELHYTLTL